MYKPIEHTFNCSGKRGWILLDYSGRWPITLVQPGGWHLGIDDALTQKLLPKEVVDALHMWVDGDGYADLSLSQYLEKMGCG